MRTKTPALLLTLALAACGGPTDAKTAARDAFQEKDYGEAAKQFEAALEGKTPQDPDYVELQVDHARALAYVEPEKVPGRVESLAEEVELEPRDYRLITTELITAKAYEPAVLVMDQGMKAYPKDEKMAKVAENVKTASQEAGDEGAMKALQGLGYVGD